MSARKKVPLSTVLQECFDSIKGEIGEKKWSFSIRALNFRNVRFVDLLITVKPKLHDRTLECGSLVDDLYQIATLAESFTKERPRSNKNWSHLADALDREGSFLQHMILSPLTDIYRRCHSMEYVWSDSSRHRY